MTALGTEARREGHKAMEEALTATARVRRQLKAGRPRTKGSLSLNSFEAMGRLVNEAVRAGELMEGAGLDPADVRLALIVRTHSDLRVSWLLAPEHAEQFFKAFADVTDAQFLGILWQQIDRSIHDANGISLSSFWVTPFVADGASQRRCWLYAIMWQRAAVNCTPIEMEVLSDDIHRKRMTNPPLKRG